MNYEKEGQATGAVGAIIALIVGVGVAVLVLLFVGVLGGQAYNIGESNINSIGVNAPVTGESFLANTSVTSSLSHSYIQEGTLAIYNSSTPHVQWGLSNFTIDYTNGLITLTGTGVAPINDSTLSANYSWGNTEIQGSIKDSIISGFSALEDTGSYLPLIVLGIVIFVVLSLVLSITMLTGGGGYGGTAL